MINKVQTVMPPIIALIMSMAVQADDTTAWTKFESTQLQQGRTIWLENCMGCHGYGIAGAPIPLEATDWEKRVTKDIDTLYDHALNGFFGPDDTMMPERGGNPNLTDSQVKLAVDYMLKLAKETLNKTP